MLLEEQLIPVRSQAEKKIDWVKKKYSGVKAIERIQVH